MITNQGYEAVSAFLRPEHFGFAIHQQIYDVMGGLIEAGRPANPLTMKDYLEIPESSGGWQYLIKLAQAAVTTVNAGSYGRTIHDLFLRRQLIAAAQEAMEAAYTVSPDVSAAQLVTQQEERLFAIGADQPRQSGFTRIGDAAYIGVKRTEEAYKAGGKLTGLATGFIELDKLTNGLNPDDLILIGGRPAMGKTSCANGIAKTVARQGITVGFFQLEQSAVQMAQRAMAEDSGVSTLRQRRGDLDLIHWNKFVEAYTEIGKLPIWIDDTASLSISQIRARARRLKRQHPNLGLIIADHLQLISGDRQEKRLEEVGAISRGLKAMAKELHVPVVALSQLTRDVDRREDKRPMMADLREAGSLEQDADVILFVFREEYYVTRQKPVFRSDGDQEKFNTAYDAWKARLEKVKGFGELILAKQREGPAGIAITLEWDAETMTFRNIEKQEDADG